MESITKKTNTHNKSMSLANYTIDFAITAAGVLFTAFNYETENGKIVFGALLLSIIVRTIQSAVGTYYNIKAHQTNKKNENSSDSQGENTDSSRL